MLAVMLNGASYFLKSEFIGTFLAQNIVTVLITVLAINTATSGLVIAKLIDISEKTKHDFKGAYYEIKVSLVFQIVLIVIAVITLMLKGSLYFRCDDMKDWQIVFNTILTMAFVASLDVLRDTGISVFSMTDNK
jgi:hypothetical protein